MITLGSVILSSRARVARNFEQFKFTVRCSSEEKREIAGFVKNCLQNNCADKKYKFFMMRGLNKSRRGILLERNLISKEMNRRLSGKGLVLTDGNAFGYFSIMVNEEDHIRIQSISRGFDLDGCLKKVTEAEEDIERSFVFAFDKELGYLTACPTNVGTGLRLSVMAHLPGLILSSKAAEFIKKINQIGYGIRGYEGEESEVIGNIFQIYSQRTLGMSETQLLKETKAVILNTFEEESAALKKLMKESPKMIEDNIYRSYGMIKYAKLLNFEEAIELVSMIKLGKDLEILDNIKDFDHYQLIIDLGRNHIADKIMERDKIDDEDIEVFRADYMRKKLLKGFDIDV